jgi:hypothetical protein
MTQLLQKNSQWCEHSIHVEFGGKRACMEYYCSAMPGIYDLAHTLFEQPKYAQPHVVARTDQRIELYGEDMSVVNVHWHYRTGVVTVEISLQAMLNLKRVIDSHFIH